jgi:hypothetical protein
MTQWVTASSADAPVEELSACLDDAPKRSVIPLRGMNGAGAAADHEGKTTHSRSMPHDPFLIKQAGRHIDVLAR